MGEQKGGVHIQYQSLGIADSVNAICEYKGERYREDFFLNTYCGGTAEPIKIQYPTCAFRKGTEGLEEMCLDCCRKAHKKYENRKCKNSLLCFDDNDEAFLQCEQRCVGTCDNHCNDQKTFVWRHAANKQLDSEAVSNNAAVTTTPATKYAKCRNKRVGPNSSFPTTDFKSFHS